MMNSSFPSIHPGAIHPILQIVLMQNSLRGEELNQFCPQAAATTFAFSSLFILLLRTDPSPLTLITPAVVQGLVSYDLGGFTFHFQIGNSATYSHVGF